MRQTIHSLAIAAGFTALVCSSSATAWSAEQSPQEAARQVDRLLAEELFDGQTADRVAERCNDETFLRRAMLDLTGRVPTPEQVIAFTIDPDEHKRAKLVDRLLADPAYGENWARYWTDVIFYRRSEDRALIASRATTEHLTEQFNNNTSWDAIASSFITAAGDVQEEGATGLIMAQAGRPEETVAEISRIFMGIQIQCAQCHDHPTDSWKREQFHELAAFFPRVAVRPDLQGERRSFIAFATDRQVRFRGQNANNRFRGTLEHRMPDLEDPSDPGVLMQPVFFATGQKLEAGASDAERRGKLAEWLTSRENPWFAAALVNRLWAELVGEGFYEPVDDMGPERQCSAPNTMQFLSESFADSGYDVKRLLQTITATEAYQRSSRNRRAPDETPFAANCAQRLRGDQLYAALDAALEFPNRFGGGRGRGPYGARFSPQALFNQTFGYDPSEPREEIAGSIPQALFMMNSPLINGAISARRGSLAQMLADSESNDDVVLELYLKTIGREPTEKEAKVCLDYIAEVSSAAEGGSRGEAFEDILWALVNSTEFRHRK